MQKNSSFPDAAPVALEIGRLIEYSSGKLAPDLCELQVIIGKVALTIIGWN